MTKATSSAWACVLAFGVLVLAPVGCHDERSSAPDAKVPAVALAALERGTEFELLSLDPDYGPLSNTRPPDALPERPFHECNVLGRTPVRDAPARKQLVAALEKGAEEAGNVMAGCFNPRHGIRALVDGKTVELVICFECLHVDVYVDGARREGFATTASPLVAFDKALRDAGLPLAAPAK